MYFLIIFILIHMISLSSNIQAEVVPKLTLPPLKPKKKTISKLNQNLFLMDENYLANFTNYQLLDKLINTSQILTSNTVLNTKLNHNILQQRLANNYSDIWNWPYDTQSNLYNLPEQVRTESDITKWKRIITLLKSINFQKAPQSDPIINPPVIQSLDENDDLSEFTNNQIQDLMNSYDKQILLPQ